MKRSWAIGAASWCAVLPGCSVQPAPAVPQSPPVATTPWTPKSARASANAAPVPTPLDDPKTCIDDPLPRREQLAMALSEPGSHVERLDVPGSDETRSGPHLQHEGNAAAGRLPPELIRWTVRAHYGEFRGCYDSGLARHADLHGTVTIRFVIGLDGAVSKVIVSDTDLPDCQVARCVRDAFSRIQFQKPDGGIVTVSYPVQLQPG